MHRKMRCGLPATDGGNAVGTLTRLSALVFVSLMIASAAAGARPPRINTSIYGFYLGESKAVLLERARKEGVSYTPKGRIASELFPESCIFDASMDRSKVVKRAVVSFYRDHVGQVNIYLVDSSEREYMQAAQSLEQSWNTFSGFSEQSFGPCYLITLPDVLITLVATGGETHISYVHRGMLGAFNEERNALSRAR
jgi:hypothetical protein